MMGFNSKITGLYQIDLKEVVHPQPSNNKGLRGFVPLVPLKKGFSKKNIWEQKSISRA